MEGEEDSACGERVAGGCEGHEVLEKGGPVPRVICSGYLSKRHSQRQSYLNAMHRISHNFEKSPFDTISHFFFHLQGLTYLLRLGRAASSVLWYKESL